MAFLNRFAQAARTLRAVCILAALSLAASTMAQTPAASATPAQNTVSMPAPKTVPGPAVGPDIRPYWTELTPAQQQALAPLASQWNKMDSNHKSKWLAIGAKYAALPPEKQQRMHDNMRDWLTLTPEQHRVAREAYARAQKLPPEQKTAQWQQYQQLPEEQKQKLAADAAAKKHVANLPNQQSKIKTVEPLKPVKPAATRPPATTSAASLQPPMPATTAAQAAPAPASPAQAASSANK